MRIRSSYWKGAAIFVLAMGVHSLFAQEEKEKRDNVKGSDLEVIHTPFERYWTKPRIVPKIGVGTMDRAFIELGVQWHDIYKHPLTLISKGPYCTVDVFIDDERPSGNYHHYTNARHDQPDRNPGGHSNA